MYILDLAHTRSAPLPLSVSRWAMVMPPAVLVYAAAAVVAMRRENESITSRKEGGSNGTVRRTEGEVWEKEAESRDACAHI